MPSGDSPRTERLSPTAYNPPSSDLTNLNPPPAPAGPNDVTMVGGVVSTTTTPLPFADRYPHIPGYRIIGELGRGGMGVVYRATQDGLSRNVAVKTLLHQNTADSSDVLRFRSEAEAVASIAHPHVVKVYESGEHEGRSYFAMEYLPGGTLHSKLRASAPFAPDVAVILVEKLARAIHSAHTLGIVHRDLKPGNVLFDSAGEPRVTDFGLAKRTSQELTLTQAVMGTPAYMPPEQAAGRAKFVGPPADIYALGVILYECLTGGTPFGGSDSLAMLNQVIADDPPSIRKKVPGVPRDLELICYKCLEKGPSDRYQTAAELADDLRRFANREPVSVRPAGVLERTVKWAKRRPTLATAYGLGVLALFLLLFGGGATYLALQESRSRAAADEHWMKAEHARDQLLVKTHDLEVAEKEAQRLQRKAEDSLDGERKALAMVAATNLDLETTSYFRNVMYAQKEAAAGNYPRAIALLDACPEEYRRWEWWHAYRTAHVEVGSGITNGVIPRDVAFTGRDIDLITTHDYGLITQFMFDKKRGLQSPLAGEDTAIGLSADGKRAVALRAWTDAFEDGVTVWDVATGKRLAAFPTPKAACRAFALSPDGKRVVFQHQGTPVMAFDVDSGKQLGTLAENIEWGRRLSHSKDGRVGVATTISEAVVWEVDTGKVLRRVSPKRGRVSVSEVTPDARCVATGSSTGDVQILPPEGEGVLVSRAHVGAVTEMAFSPDGKRLATAGDDGAVRVWDSATGKLFVQFRGHIRGVTALAFHPDGSKVVSCDSGGGFRVWELFNQVGSSETIPVASNLKRLFVTDRDLTRMFAAEAESLGFEVSKGTAASVSPPSGEIFTAAAIHPNSRQKAIGTSGGNVYLQDSTDKTPRLIHSFPTEVRMLKYSDDGERLLGTSGSEYRVWRTTTGEVLADMLTDTPDAVFGMSGDGKRVAVAFARGSIIVSEIEEKKSYSLRIPDDVSMLTFTPDGKSLVVGTRQWGLSVYPLTPDEKGIIPANYAITYIGHSAPVTCAAYSPDGSRIAAGAADGTIRLWEMKSAREASGLAVQSKDPIISVWFTSNGQKLVALPDSGPPVVFDGSSRELVVRWEKPPPALTK